MLPAVLRGLGFLRAPEDGELGVVLGLGLAQRAPPRLLRPRHLVLELLDRREVVPRHLLHPGLLARVSSLFLRSPERPRFLPHLLHFVPRLAVSGDTARVGGPPLLQPVVFQLRDIHHPLVPPASLLLDPDRLGEKPEAIETAGARETGSLLHLLALHIQHCLAALEAIRKDAERLARGAQHRLEPRNLFEEGAEPVGGRVRGLRAPGRVVAILEDVGLQRRVFARLDKRHAAVGLLRESVEVPPRRHPCHPPRIAHHPLSRHAVRLLRRRRRERALRGVCCALLQLGDERLRVREMLSSVAERTVEDGEGGGRHSHGGREDSVLIHSCFSSRDHCARAVLHLLKHGFDVHVRRGGMPP
mmetsp:Transcript_67650/g.161875  ORF Transcript_67650/g.161875 Transcript_67650/m.161875 type:complete len:359 (-) Transcript_67650:610-1686(-)